MPERENKSAVLKLIISLSVIAAVSRAFPVISNLYYLLPLLFLVTISFRFKEILKDEILTMLLIFLLTSGIWSALTSLWSAFPLVTISRSVYFIFISSGAVLSGYFWQKTDSGILSFLLPANILVIVLSLFSLITNIPPDSWTGGHGKGFMGFAGHQNTLGSIILFTIPGVINQIIIRSGKSEVSNQKSGVPVYIWLLTGLSLLILILTYSRASILSLICGILIFLILSAKWRILIYSVSFAVLFFLIIYFSPSLSSRADEIIKKDFPAFYSSREWLWEPSYKAALKGGLFGLGYGISDPEIILTGTGSHYESERYVREKGNSFLALIEETGVVGLILFLLPFCYLLIKYMEKKKELSNLPVSGVKPATSNPKSITNFLFASLAAFFIHSQFEAWMVGVGSIQLPLFFFYIGCLSYSIHQPQMLNEQ